MGDPGHILATATRAQYGLAGLGLFSQVFMVKNTNVALKVCDQPGGGEIIERKIYERLGSHPYILKYFGKFDSACGRGLALEFLPAGSLAENLALHNFPEERMEWPIQAVEAIRYIHSKGVCHCDLSVNNFLIQEDGSLALADFCGSMIDGSEPLVATGTRYSRPQTLEERRDDKSDERDDLFALGTLLHEMTVGERLHADKTNGEIYTLFMARTFPDTTKFGNLGVVMTKCWMEQYSSAEEIKGDMDSMFSRSRRLFLEYIGSSLLMALVFTALHNNMVIS